MEKHCRIIHAHYKKQKQKCFNVTESKEVNKNYIKFKYWEIITVNIYGLLGL